MISIYATSFVSTAKMTDLSVASACSLGVSGCELITAGLSPVSTAGPVVLSGRPVRVRDERPAKALEAGVAAAQAKAYAFAASSAEAKKQINQHHTMWAFRGPEPWSDPA